MIDKKKVLDAVIVLEDFLDTVPGGESYWIDDEGKKHTADLGYVNEFLIDLKEYTIDAWEEPSLSSNDIYVYKVYISYKYIPMHPICVYCQSYHFDTVRDALVLDNLDDGARTITILYDKILAVTIIDMTTNNNVYTYSSGLHIGFCYGD